MTLNSSLLKSKLYKNLIACNSWNLARTSSGGELGTFPGFVIRDNYTNVFNNYWDGYFNCLYERIKIKIPNNPKKINKLIPETKIKANHVKIISIDCPISGCEINNKIIGTIKNRLNKYLKYKLYF